MSGITSALEALLRGSRSVSQFNMGRGRFYRARGHKQPMPSVTSVLSVIGKPALQAWASKMALQSVREQMFPEDDESVVIDSSRMEEVMQQARLASDVARDTAATFGTRAHDTVEAILKGEVAVSDVKDADLQPILGGYQQWREYESELDVHMTEVTVFSKMYNYAGTVDAVASRPGSDKFVLLDWKTSNRIYDDYALQLAAYAKAVKEMTGVEVEEAWIVRFDKDKPKFEAKRVVSIEHCFDTFYAALSLYNKRKVPLFERAVTTHGLKKLAKQAKGSNEE